MPVKKAKKKTIKSSITKKPRFVCNVCSAVIIVEVPCKCVACDIICCGEQMKEK